MHLVFFQNKILSLFYHLLYIRHLKVLSKAKWLQYFDPQCKSPFLIGRMRQITSILILEGGENGFISDILEIIIRQM